MYQLEPARQQGSSQRPNVRHDTVSDLRCGAWTNLTLGGNQRARVALFADSWHVARRFAAADRLTVATAVRALCVSRDPPSVYNRKRESRCWEALDGDDVHQKTAEVPLAKEWISRCQRERRLSYARSSEAQCRRGHYKGEVVVRAAAGVVPL